ncbi:CLUMA_CG001781, isoform A [Clunio marinus]|uniref:CLUMA_CG001781, isoform A n=1 Tax=Clunio marinus TaxID=568069 RepID=A0A1J1HJA6_9DIPT|nr:CLUMA_CG001781, isoform A [Clunio marinus]
MSLTRDIFSNLNEYLAKDDSFKKYELDNFSQDNSVCDTKDPKVVDLSNNSIEPEVVTATSDDLLDLTADYSPPVKTRRAADKLSVEILETVEIEDQPESSNNNSKTRRRSGRLSKVPIAKEVPKVKQAPKAKKISYKEALNVMNSSIPKLPETPKPSTMPVDRYSGIDLTGDVSLGEMHSHAPLFQNKSIQKLKSATKVIVDDSDEDDMNLDSIKVKVKVNNKIQAHKYRQHQNFYDLYKIISEQNGIPLKDIFLYDNDKRLEHSDTPHSINYKITKILKCHVLEGNEISLDKIQKKDQIVLKFQSDKWKKPVTIQLSKFDTFKTAVCILCEKIPFKSEQITLSFVGDSVDMNQNSVDLDLDGGEIFDCYIKA